MNDPKLSSSAAPGRRASAFRRPGRAAVKLLRAPRAAASACGPLQPFEVVCVRSAAEGRGRRCPLGAHAVAVYASLRLRCGARPSVASQNSLRSLRSLRSDNCDESVHEARCARRLKACAPRRHTNRPHQVPPAARQRRRCLLHTPPAHPQRCVRAGRSAPVERREAQRSRPRAKRESSSDSSQLFERSERSERSEFCYGAAGASIAGQPERSAGRSSEAPRPARACLCRADAGFGRNCQRTTATGRKQKRRNVGRARVSLQPASGRPQADGATLAGSGHGRPGVDVIYALAACTAVTARRIDSAVAGAASGGSTRCPPAAETASRIA